MKTSFTFKVCTEPTRDVVVAYPVEPWSREIDRQVWCALRALRDDTDVLYLSGARVQWLKHDPEN